MSVNRNPSKIIGIQFSILSAEEIRKNSVAEITTRDTYVNNKPVINGIFDPRMGVIEPGFICPTDGKGYMETPGYFGHIELAKPVFYIQYLNTIVKILRCVCIKCSKLLINKEKHKNLLKLDSKTRWEQVFALCNKIKRCGQETECGCGCIKPKKIYKETSTLATIYATWDNSEKIANEEGEVEDKINLRLTPRFVLTIFKRICDEDINFMGFSHLWSKPSSMICQALPVPPPAVRPSVKHDAQQRSEDDISHIIVCIIKANKALQEKIQQNAASKIIDDWHTVLQYYIATMIDNNIPGVAAVAQRSGRELKAIKQRLNGKGGRVRGNLMGKRVDQSARSVITPDAKLGIRQLGVPKKIAMNITSPTVVNSRNKSYLTKLVLNGPDVWPGANILEKKNGDSVSLKYVDRNSLNLENGDIVHRHLFDGDPVLFNRQPTLHRMSMMCHIVKVMREGSTFRMNVADTKPYNADFDGDEMNLHGPQDIEAAAELRNLAAVDRQIISPAKNQSIIGIFQDSCLGSYRLTRENINFDIRKAMNLLMGIKTVDINKLKDKGTINSFELLSHILPPLSCKFANGGYKADVDNNKTTNNIIEIRNGKMIRGQFDKKSLGTTSKGLIQSIFNDFGYKASADFIDDLQDIVTEYMKLSSYSVGISDLIANEITNNKINDTLYEMKKKVKNLIDQMHTGVFENNTGKTNQFEFETQVSSILNNAEETARKIGRNNLAKDNRFVTMVNAGSKGNNINISQMISCLGQQNVDGKRIPYGFEDRTLPHYTKYNDTPEARGFVQSSFIQGMTPEEMFFHAQGGRLGLIDTAVKTSQTGYIQRRLIKACEDLKVNYDMTVRNNKNKIVQFSYGSDNFEPTRIENQTLPLTNMSLEEIFAHFKMPSNDDTDVFNINFTKETLSAIRNEKKDLVEITKTVTNEMIGVREELIKHVFKYNNKNVIHIPVHFLRLIQNIKHQFNIQRDSLVDISPFQLYQLLNKTFANLEKIHSAKPTLLFKTAFYYYLTPKELLLINKFNMKACVYLLKQVEYMYKKAIVHPGEMVGVIAAQSLGEPTTQMTLNTFHFAGVASKSNVTRGVPRIEEILSLSKNPKNPSITIFLPKDKQEDIENAMGIKYKLEYTNLRDITDTVSICFDPDNMNSLVEADQYLMNEYYQFQQMMEECGMEEAEENFSKWIIRIELNKEEMLDKNINMDDVHFAIRNSYKNGIKCIYSDFNDDNLVMRLRLDGGLSKNKQKSLDKTDEIYVLKNIQDNLLNLTVLKGVKSIPKVLTRTIKNYITKKEGNYVPTDIWVLDTVGTNLVDILGNDDIDYKRTATNDIQETFRVLGIEAARQCIYNEIEEAISFDGTYINCRHIEMLADRMCTNIKMVSVFRHGINNDDIGPIAKASFEETPEMFLRAARHAELDLMTGVSSNIMCGQEGNFGTKAFQIILDHSKIAKMAGKKLKQEEQLDDKLFGNIKNDYCQNISINDTAAYIQEKDTGDIDDEYDPGF
jgi:DNA-directed RNA polymerase II subunit RPB1